MWGNPPLLANAEAEPQAPSMEKPHRHGRGHRACRLRGVPHVCVGPLNVTQRGSSALRVAVRCRQGPPYHRCCVASPVRGARGVRVRSRNHPVECIECRHDRSCCRASASVCRRASPPFVDTTYSLPGRGSHVYGPGHVRGHTGSGRRIDAPVGGAHLVCPTPPAVVQAEAHQVVAQGGQRKRPTLEGDTGRGNPQLADLT
jgi:hypothetical protein